ncbi:membrane fusion protein (multidrug efflux system) [Sphingomonas endophytica]|uniref:Membrane fusion protein (Multidrug efflux system) n=2 Tax=Sphingomonas endophytica TaxID=869719 RepID=A0ABR6N4E4_9SPHN|nr:HlyD family efflux transporter periplasmic adaptor subunit [Sphingomonas endophytica]MBB5724677.1 membrane fusion protein (multidrug efflux system) [Sphingomonas endophytica]
MPQIAGTVVSIAADNGDLVRAGQTVVGIDPTDSGIAVEAAEANLASAVRKVRGLYNNATGARDALTGAEADVTARTSALEKVRADYERRRTLGQSGAIAAEDVAHARDALTAAEAALTAARSSLATLRQQFQATNALVDETALSSHPDVKAAAVRLRAALLEQARTSLKAPIAGYIAKRTAQIGQRLQPGEPLMAIVPLRQAWVDANFSETQLANVRIGQPVTIRSDLYGGDTHYAGKVESIGVGTGSAFALLPAQNATGNWIKIVQRIPVRVVFTDPRQLDEHPVRVGMSMRVQIDVHDQGGAVLPSSPPTRPLFSSDLYRQQLAEADAKIAQVIRVNSAAQSAATVKP